MVNLQKISRAGRILSAYALDRHGIAQQSARCVWKRAWRKIEHNLDPRDFFAPGFGDIIAEVPDGQVGNLQITYTVIGEVTEDGRFSYGDCVIGLDEAEDAWKGTLEKVFATRSGAEESAENWVLTPSETADGELKEDGCFRASRVHICSHKIAQPHGIYSGIPGNQL